MIFAFLSVRSLQRERRAADALRAACRPGHMMMNTDDDVISKEEKCDEDEGKPERFGELLDTCWHQNQDMRPEFREVVSFFKKSHTAIEIKFGGGGQGDESI